ncbi:MAG TPA: fumarylacetoacetate hydrolase family protein [Candidatus Eremiobacteraceae bacterium]|nr:fumarylacetoacetate hydrolase family protein [Candidatus Eremiobacteraceae bacterium]
MKICRFSEGGSSKPRFGILQDGTITELAGAPWIPGSGKKTGKNFAPADVRLLAPVTPSKIVCVGRNYAAHAAELGNEVPKEPLIFLKPPSSIIGPGEAILLPKYSGKVEHEGELGMVVGRKASHLSDSDEALSYLCGYTCVNDVTARDLQKADVQFTRAKGFDTFCPVGPHIETELNPNDLTVECRVNGVVRQTGRTSLMIFSPAFLVRWISRMMTLEPGDLIATGTPAGVGPLVAGDTAEVSVQGIAVLSNPVHPAQA